MKKYSGIISLCLCILLVLISCLYVSDKYNDNKLNLKSYSHWYASMDDVQETLEIMEYGSVAHGYASMEDSLGELVVTREFEAFHKTLNSAITNLSSTLNTEYETLLINRKYTDEDIQFFKDQLKITLEQIPAEYSKLKVDDIHNLTRQCNERFQQYFEETQNK